MSSQGELTEALSRAGLDPYDTLDRVQIVDTATPAGGFALREMTDDEHDRYGDEPVHSRWDPETGEVTSWIEPADLDRSDWHSPRAGEQRRRIDELLADLEQRAAALTREAAGDTLARHQVPPAAGAGEALEAAAAAARVAALDHGWDTAALIAEAHARDAAHTDDARRSRRHPEPGGRTRPPTTSAGAAVSRWVSRRVGRLKAGRPSEER